MILCQPKRYLTRVFLPSFLSYVCKFVVIGIFLAAFAIPVTFESITWIVGSGSLANVASFTPGRGRGDPGDERACAGRVLQRAEEHRDRLLDGAAAHHDRLERPLRDGARDLGLRLDGRQARSSRAPTSARRSRSPNAGKSESARRPRRRRRSRRPTTTPKAPSSRLDERRRDRMTKEAGAPAGRGRIIASEVLVVVASLTAVWPCSAALRWSASGSPARRRAVERRAGRSPRRSRGPSLRSAPSLASWSCSSGGGRHRKPTAGTSCSLQS